MCWYRKVSNVNALHHVHWFVLLWYGCCVNASRHRNACRSGGCTGLFWRVFLLLLLWTLLSLQSSFMIHGNRSCFCHTNASFSPSNQQAQVQTQTQCKRTTARRTNVQRNNKIKTCSEGRMNEDKTNTHTEKNKTKRILYKWCGGNLSNHHRKCMQRLAWEFLTNCGLIRTFNSLILKEATRKNPVMWNSHFVRPQMATFILFTIAAL